MKKEVTKYITSNPNLVFIGKEKGEYGEECYLELKDSLRGWSFMGLRPQTEKELRESARETDPHDLLGISSANWNIVSTYFDSGKFADDMEDEWEERHDVQATREISISDDGNISTETLYLGFGSGTDVFSYFKKNTIVSYEAYITHFEEVGLDQKTFEMLLPLIIAGQKHTGIHSIDDTKENKRRTVEMEAIKAILLPSQI